MEQIRTNTKWRTEWNMGSIAYELFLWALLQQTLARLQGTMRSTWNEICQMEDTHYLETVYELIGTSHQLPYCEDSLMNSAVRMTNPKPSSAEPWALPTACSFRSKESPTKQSLPSILSLTPLFRKDAE